MKRFCSITVRMLSIMLVLLLFVIGRMPEAFACDDYAPRQQEAPSQGQQITDEELASIEVGHTPDDAPFKHKPVRAHSKGKHHRKIWHGKPFQLKFSLPTKQQIVPPVLLSEETTHFGRVSSYYYLFFREINPPPPKRA